MITWSTTQQVTNHKLLIPLKTTRTLKKFETRPDGEQVLEAPEGLRCFQTRLPGSFGEPLPVLLFHWLTSSDCSVIRGAWTKTEASRGFVETICGVWGCQSAADAGLKDSCVYSLTHIMLWLVRYVKVVWTSSVSTFELFIKSLGVVGDRLLSLTTNRGLTWPTCTDGAGPPPPPDPVHCSPSYQPIKSSCIVTYTITYSTT